MQSERRIRLANTMSVILICMGIVVLIYVYFINWPRSFFMLISLLVILACIPPVLNYFQKTIASRIFLVVLTYIGIMLITIFIGSEINFQYFFFAFLGFPIIFLGNELGLKNLLLSGVAILLYIYLEWHFKTFEPLIHIDLKYSYIIRLANDLMILLLIFFQFYFFVKENECYTQNIIEKSNELIERNVELEHFAYIASHDLNEPLRTVNSFVDIIKEEYSDKADENLNTYFTFINDALSRMKLMIEGMLNYSRIGKSGEHQMVDLNSLIHEVKTDLGELIKQKNVTIEISNLPKINCLQLEVRQLFQNLITNAIKFQQPDVAPLIKITQKEIPGYWQFCVADNGIGISHEKHKTIFQMFTKLHLRQKYEGHGIGLAFCKKIVASHKGAIWVKSSPGNGSQFYFTIEKDYKYEKETPKHSSDR